MTEQERGAGNLLAAGEQEQLLYALETRLATHLEAAAATVREAERELNEAREQLTRALRAADEQRYTSDPLVFMRASVTEELEALERKTNAKKLRTSYRFLLDRAVELAAEEVQGFHDEQNDAQQERLCGVAACRAAEERAVDTLEAARAMQERALAAEQSARQGLSLVVARMTSVAER